MYKIGHWVEGSLPSPKIRSGELAHVSDDLSDNCSRLHDEYGRSSSFVYKYKSDKDRSASN